MNATPHTLTVAYHAARGPALDAPQISVRVNQETYQRLIESCRVRGLRMSQVVRRILEDSVSEHNERDAA